MKLSPFSHYFIRQLLQQYFGNLSQLVAEPVRQEDYFQIDLNHLLKSLYSDDLEVDQKIREIEALMAIHQAIAPSGKGETKTLIEVELRLYRLLGLRLPSAFISSPPAVLTQPQVSFFNFYHQNMIRRGANYGGELYGAIQWFASSERLNAYQVAWVLKNYGVPAILTMSSCGCEIWVNLRSPTYPLFLQNNQELLKRFVTLHAILFKCREASWNKQLLASPVIATSSRLKPSKYH